MSLNPAIEIDLREQRDNSLRSGELLSPERLAECYATFRGRFGPEALARLDGEALLEDMHLHGNKNSLVYWLEFKNDDEMPNHFGSIAGGSALKFGIYRRADTGKWLTGSPQHQVELSVEKAIERARTHRDELIAGSRLLDRFPADGTDDDYQHLQHELETVAPGLADWAWSHKYWALLHSTKLDDFHVASYQRYHLIRVLQIPPAAEGRYVCAGRFVALARELDMPMNHVTSLLVGRNGEPRSYWRIGTRSGDSNIARQYWPDMRDGGFVALGWNGLPDLSDLAEQAPTKANKEDLRARFDRTAEAGRKNASVVGNFASQVYNFIHLADGDIVLAGDGATILGIGRVDGTYRFDSAHPFAHQLPVKWLDLTEWKLDPYEGPQRTVHQLKHARNLVETEQHLLGPTSPPVHSGTHGTNTPPGKRPVQRLEGIAGRIQSVLERKGQVILYGPPGTGKTYWASSVARDLAAMHAFGGRLNELSIDQRPIVLGHEATQGLVRTVTFHPAYGYEDFLEGYRPMLTNGQMAFARRDGIFKQFCKDAENVPERRFYLIIDEINRGDIPRIFGELLTILEKDKRGESVLLAVSGEPFRVPDNVYILGTMNTADRSIALFDAALRRRFGFVELMPDSFLLGKVSVAGVPLGRWLDALNARVREYGGRDARNLQVGHSYLLEQEHPIEHLSRLAQVLRDDIVPLIQEYTYEDYNALAKILGVGLVDTQQLRIRNEVFEPSRSDELVRCLLELNPELATSPESVDAEAAAEEELDAVNPVGDLESDDEPVQPLSIS